MSAKARVPYPFVDGLSEKGQRQLERNFQSLQANIVPGNEPALFIASSIGFPDDFTPAKADLVVTGTDDSDQINTFLAANPGRIVVIGPGPFDHTSTIVVPDATTIIGSGTADIGSDGSDGGLARNRATRFMCGSDAGLSTVTYGVSDVGQVLWELGVGATIKNFIQWCDPSILPALAVPSSYCKVEDIECFSVFQVLAHSAAALKKVVVRNVANNTSGSSSTCSFVGVATYTDSWFEHVRGFPFVARVGGGGGQIAKNTACCVTSTIIDIDGALTLSTDAGTDNVILPLPADAIVDPTAIHSGDAAGGDLTGTYPNPTLSILTRASSGSSVLAIRITGEGTNNRVNWTADGAINWGPGTGATDTRLSRSGVNILNTAGRYRATHAAVGSTSHDLVVSGDTVARFTITTDGSGNPTLSFGPGNAAVDVTLARSAAKTLTVSQELIVSGGVVTKAKAGVPTDSDLPGTAQDGALIVDTTDGRLYFRSGAAWTFAPSSDSVHKDMVPSFLVEGAGVLTYPTPAAGSTPTGAAGGSLAGTYPNPTFAGRDGSTDAINKDLLPSLLTDGYGVRTFPLITAAGPKGTASKVAQITYDAYGRLTLVTEVNISGAGIDSTAVHSGDTAGGSLAGTYPNPTFAGRDPSVDAINKDMVPGLLIAGVGIITYPIPASGSAPTGAAGGSLAGTYPNPTFAGRDPSVDALNKDMTQQFLLMGS